MVAIEAMQKAKLRLVEWYKDNARELPWRKNRDPYRIWISETMLQQTTTTAVIPFYERFLAKLPTLQSLAAAPIETVIELWAGLGYYARARTLHAAGQQLHARGGFPKTYEELIELKGFGPYTSRAVASLAFGQSVGVVDGNVIRVLSRFYGEKWEWWQARLRPTIQALVDQWVEGVSSAQMNQALMELGRTICTPKQTSCLLCPLRPDCVAFKKDIVAQLPLVRPRRQREIWQWTTYVHTKNQNILLQKNSTAPFLKGQWLLPGVAKRLVKKPSRFDYKHSITHHDIFVTVRQAVPKMDATESKWVPVQEIRKHVPASLVQKALSLLSLPDSNDSAPGMRVAPKNRKHTSNGSRSSRRSR
jgi:A/G-specific adenine glycosylase